MSIEEIVKNLMGTFNSLKATEAYIKNDNKGKSQMLYSILAARLAYQYTAIPSETDIMIRQYYLNVIQPLVRDVLAAINEIEVIDYVKIENLVYPLYLTRYDIAHGKMSLKDIHTLVGVSTRISDDDRRYIQEAVDALN